MKRDGCKPECPDGFHHHIAVGVTRELATAAYERGDWEPQPRADEPAPSRPRKSTPRGLPRMREHTRSLLLNALRGDGTIEATIRVSTCRAMRVLPWDIGYEHTSRITAGDGRPTGQAAVDAAYRAAVIEPMAAHLSQHLAAPAGLTFESQEFRPLRLAFPDEATTADPNGDPTA